MGGGPSCLDDAACPADEDCVDHGCSGGACVSTARVSGEPCLLAPSGFCDAQGECVACVDDAQCPPPLVPECATARCDAISHYCFFEGQPVNTPCPGGYCLGVNCNECNDSTQCPEEDCREAGTCDAFVCNRPTVPSGAPCNFTPGGICDGAGTCVACGASCPSPGPCEHLVCNQGSCEVAPDAPGSPCAGGVCDAAGQCVECLSVFDCPGEHMPSAGMSCEWSECLGNACVFHDKADGTPCGNFGDGRGCVNGGCSGCISSVGCSAGFSCCGAPSYLCVPFQGGICP